jgi:F-type H+-transporting ATPase subunit epsilon
MQFDLVSPERSLASLAVSEVHIPGAEGDMTVLPDHAPLITTLRPGVLKIVSASGTDEYLVTGGFAQIGSDGTSVLAERALPKSEVTKDILDALAKDAGEALEKATPESVDALGKQVSDVASLVSEMGPGA